VGRGWLPAGQLVGDEGLDVLAAKLAGEDRVAVGLAVGGEQPDGVGTPAGQGVRAGGRDGRI
jgi:hypothetical protein